MRMVIVNRKYLVQVEAENNYKAEHMILDLEGNMVESATAFDPATEAEYYGWAFAKCKIMSFADFKAAVNKALAARYKAMNKALENIQEALMQIDLLKMQLDAAYSDYYDLKAEYEEHSKEWGIVGFTAAEKIKELEAC